MPSSPLLRTSDQNGAVLIGIGLAFVLVAQAIGGVPVAAAMALIGWGAVLTGTRRNTLALVNLIVYALLVSFTIASQTHAALGGQVGIVLLTDHLVAVALLAVLARFVVCRLDVFST